MNCDYAKGLELLTQANNKLGSKFQLLLDIRAGIVRNIVCSISFIPKAEEVAQLQEEARQVLEPLCEAAGIGIEMEKPSAVAYPIRLPT